MHYNIALRARKNIFFIKKKLFNAGMRMEVEIPEPVGYGYEIRFSILIGYW